MLKSGKLDSGFLAGFVITLAVIAGVTSLYYLDSSGRKGSGLSADYQFDISQYTKIDPQRILYKQVGQPIPTSLKLSHSLFVQNDIYIAGDDKIVNIGEDGAVKDAIDLTTPPSCLVVSVDGVIWAGAGQNVISIDTKNTKRTQFSVPSDKAVLTSMVFKDDLLFVADAANGLIYCYKQDGTLVHTMGAKDPAKEDSTGFVIPSPYFDIALAPDGLLRVVDPGRHLIIAYTDKGDREWSWGLSSPKIEGFSGCCNPVNIAILPDGSFVTVEKGLVRVKIYDSDGKFVGVVAGPEQLEWSDQQQVCNTPEQCQSKGFDVAVDTDGRIYVLDTVKNVIRVFEKK